MEPNCPTMCFISTSIVFMSQLWEGKAVGSGANGTNGLWVKAGCQEPSVIVWMKFSSPHLTPNILFATTNRLKQQ
jgi:hypothetical protein